MAELLTSDKTASFMDVVRSVNSALRNSIMYPAGHPMLTASVKSLKAVLDGWLCTEGKLDMAFSRSSVLLDKKPVNEGNPVLADLAEHFHQRGVLALTIRPGVTHPEVSALLSAIREPPETIASAGGIASKLRTCPHVTVKQIDYSPLLKKGGGRAGVSSADSLVRVLCEAEMDAKTGILSRTTAGNFISALADPGKFAANVNQMYNTSGKPVSPETEGLWRVVGMVARLGKSLPPGESAEIRGHLASVFAALSTEALSALFREPTSREGMDDLQDCALQALPDRVLSDMIAARISCEGRVDNSLMNIFMRLSAKADGSRGLASSVASKLADTGRKDLDRLTAVQAALEEALKSAAKNEFMSQVYQLTVDSLAEKSRAMIATDGVVAGLVAGFEHSLHPARADEARILLLLNILWFEEDHGAFKDLSEKLLNLLPRCRDEIQREMAPDALKVFWEKTRPGIYPAIAHEAGIALQHVGPLAGAPAVAALIPDASPSQLENLGRALAAAGQAGVQALLDLLLCAENNADSANFSLTLAAMRLPAAQADILARRAGSEKNSEARKVILRMLAGSRDKTVLKSLFSYFAGQLFRPRILLELVKECGQCKAEESVPFLAELLHSHSPPLPGRSRIVQAAVESLCHIRSTGAVAVLQKSIQEKNRTVQRACQRLMLSRDER